MRFHDYGPHYRTYVIVHTTGCGEQGGEPVREKEIRDSFDTKEEAEEYGPTFYPPDPSGWTYDNYTINVNTHTDEGKAVEIVYKAEMEERFRELEAKIAANPENYTTYKADGYTITVEHNEALDGPRKPKEEP